MNTFLPGAVIDFLMFRTRDGLQDIKYFYTSYKLMNTFLPGAVIDFLIYRTRDELQDFKKRESDTLSASRIELFTTLFSGTLTVDNGSTSSGPQDAETRPAASHLVSKLLQ